MKVGLFPGSGCDFANEVSGQLAPTFASINDSSLIFEEILEVASVDFAS